MSKTHSEKEETILVFDVEGVDGRERGESEQVTHFILFSYLIRVLNVRHRFSHLLWQKY
jgi:hypothetical protein